MEVWGGVEKKEGGWQGEGRGGGGLEKKEEGGVE